MRRSRAAVGIGLLAASLAFVGCAGLLGPTATLEERRAFAEAESAGATGEEAREAYRRFLERYPTSPLAPDAELALGDLERADGELEAAERRYRRALEARGSAVDRARVRLAALALERGESAAARGWLRPVRLSRLEDADLRNAYRALAESAESPAERVRWLGALRGEVPDAEDVAVLDAELDSELARLPASELERAARAVGERPPAARIYLSLAERRLLEGEVEAAREALEAARRRALAPRYAGRLAELEAQLHASTDRAQAPEALPGLSEVLAAEFYPDTAGASGTLGALLPLSGPYAPFGERALHGILLAAGSFEGGAGSDVRVLVRDSGGDPERAAAAVHELAEAGVVAIVGPIMSSVCEAAAEEAESLGLPLLALTARESIARDRDWVFRMRTSPAEEAEVVVDQALAQGDRRFAILYPNHAAGLGFRSLFWDAVEARGGEIVGVASYDPEATDFGESIRRLVGYTLLDDEERALLRRRDRMLKRARRLPDGEARSLRAAARSLKRKDGGPIPPIVDFDALYIPDSHENVVLIVPQLAFHEATGARLLGTGAWLHEDLVRLGGRYLEGALFPSDVHAGSELEPLRDFAQRYQNIFGEAPEGFAAQSYDAAHLLIAQLARGDDDRRSLRGALLDARVHAGVSGVVSLGPDGRARKRPLLLGVVDGQLAAVGD